MSKSHVYREQRPNRHGHSNEKPSFFALGYEDISAYAASLSPQEWIEYAKMRAECKGMRQYNLDHSRLCMEAERLAAKRLRREECKIDTKKRIAAIIANKQRR